MDVCARQNARSRWIGVFGRRSPEHAEWHIGSVVLLFAGRNQPVVRVITNDPGNSRE
jgi:hypothetical protein